MLPKRLPTAAVLGAFTPSDSVTPERLTRIHRNVRALSEKGIRVVFAPHALDSPPRGTLAVSDRCDDISALATNDAVDALIATCGGKTSNALLPYIAYDELRRARKPLIGFSDVGVLLNAVTAVTGLVTFYGPNVLSKLHESRDSLLQSLTDCSPPGLRKCLRAICIRPGSVEGTLIGGNLSTFAMSIAGSRYEPVVESPVLFWESGTRDWRLIEQHLGALAVRGTLGRIKGMIVGRVGDAEDVDDDDALLLRALASGLSVPILWTPSFGHGATDNLPWPIGGRVLLDATGRRVILPEPLVAEV